MKFLPTPLKSLFEPTPPVGGKAKSKIMLGPKFFLVLTFFLGFVLTLVLAATPARAVILQDENTMILEGGPGTPGFDDKAFNLNQLGGTIDNLNYLLTGQSEAHPELAALGGHGAIGTVGNLIGSLYTPPASSIQYFAYLKQNLGLATPAYAQGAGFTGLSYLLPIWRAFRNAAYLFFVLLFVITGLLLMFRVKVSPQAVASIQNSLPRLVITLILITLSYAIAGLMIDLMYVVIYLLLNLVKSAGIAVDNLDQFQGVNVFQYWSTGASLGFESINKPAEGISQFIEQITGNTFVISGVLSTPARGIATVVFTIAILWALFRLLFILIKAYVWVLVMVIFAPFQLLLGALPGGGGNMGISGWLRGLLANLAVFPTTIVMFALASALIQLAQVPGAGTGWVAPLIGGSSIQAVQALIAFGLILLTPTVAQMMNDALKPPPFPYGAAITQGLGGAATAFWAGGRGTWGERARISRERLEKERHEQIISALGAKP